MSTWKRLVTRREFLENTAKATAGVALLTTTGFRFGGQETAGSPTTATVVLVRNAKVLDSTNKVDRTVIKEMLDEAVMNLFGTKTAEDAWKQMVKPTDVVGVKTNAWQSLPTPKEVESVVKEHITNTGVKEENIAVQDRKVLDNDVFSKSTALFNLCTLRTHFWSGTGGCIKNYILFVRKPWEYHDDQCADLGSIWNLPHVKGKTRLNVLCALRPLFWGRGPHHFDEQYVWNYGGLIVGTDPVAVDAVGCRLLQAKRLAFFGEDRPLDTTPKHVMVADTKHKLGTSDLGKIKLIKLGWDKDLLI